MKHPTGSVRPRRLASSQSPKARKKVRLDLKRAPQPESDPELGLEKKSSFWKWVTLVALLHLLVIAIVCLVYQMTPVPKPPEQFISLLPEGDVVKGTPGAQQAHKLGPTTAAATVHHHHTESKPPPTRPPVAVAPPKLLLPPPTLQPPPPAAIALNKPTSLPPPKPAPPKPKVKVDLTLADGPEQPVDKPKKHQPKKPVVKPTEEADDQDSADNPDSTGLSKEQIAAQLGEKLDAPGVKDANHTGTSGSTNTRENAFKDFYLQIAQQVMDQWHNPSAIGNIPETPVGIHIYVEKDGHIRPGSVYLTRSCGNSVYDDSAIATVNSLGYLHEPLPEGCPPDISINVKPAQ
jgi:hypothetical protein